MLTGGLRPDPRLAGGGIETGGSSSKC